MDWILFKDNFDKCTISWFDDGNQKYKSFHNLWYIIGTNNKGKYKLKNIKNPGILIDSISTWKTTKC